MHDCLGPIPVVLHAMYELFAYNEKIQSCKLVLNKCNTMPNNQTKCLAGETLA